ncbi:unnamed protein product [Mytilus coruscus]|uniref:Uncharacterized protein n=1 Tax=Mytilus coruscus TaxID=42192 RepID=A0A6J8EZX0_MYTCO|nr:unnamed protein product [Mytilus coruscus]
MYKNNVIDFYECFLVLILASKFLICEPSEVAPKPMSVIVHKDVLLDQEHVQVLNPPSVLTNASNLKVQYLCSGQKIVSVEIEAVITYSYKDVHSKLFHKSWKCSKGSLRTRNVPLKLNEKIVFRPDFINKDIIFIDNDSVIIRAWIIGTDMLPIAKQNDDGYKRSRVKVFYLSSIPPPYSRPQRKIYKSCLSWRYTVLVSLSVSKINTCSYENEVADFLKYPLSLNGLQYGVYRSVNKFMNDELEYKRMQLVNKPRFTITVWVYILEYCTRSLCSIVHRAMWNGTYYTPLIFVNKKGNLHIQVSLANGETRAAITDITIPRHQWVRLVFVFDKIKWKLTFNYGKEFNQTESTEFTFDSEVYMDDTEGLFVIGGSDTTPGFSGFIGKLKWYRNKAVESDQIAFPDPYHPMFQLDFVKRAKKCQRFTERNQRLFSAYKTKRNTISAEDTCHQHFYRYIQHENQTEMINKCLQSDEPLPKYHKHIRQIIKYQAAIKHTFILTDANRMLYEKGVKLMEKGLRKVKAALPILKQSACFGNYDAMFMVSVILNNGIGVKADEIQSQAYLLLAARGQHRLSSLCLGHKHMYGLDGVLVDKEQAYRKNLVWQLKRKGLSEGEIADHKEGSVWKGLFVRRAQPYRKPYGKKRNGLPHCQTSYRD